MHKKLNGLAPGSVPEMFERQRDIHQYSKDPLMGLAFLFYKVGAHRHLSTGQEAISYAGARFWNEIPIDIRRAQSLEAFKRKLKENLYIFGMQNTE